MARLRLNPGGDPVVGYTRLATSRESRAGATRTRFAGFADGADLLDWQMRAAGLPAFEREFIFHPTRKWRLDLAEPTRKLAVEVEGFSAGGAAGRHQRPSGFTADVEKYNELTLLGWRLIRATTAQVKSGRALQWIERALLSIQST